jgi:hypothetical protein
MAESVKITPAHHKFIDNFSDILNCDLNNGPRKNHDPRYFRWFDTGDLQNLEMLWVINEIAYLTPEVTHWLPTKQTDFILEAVLQQQDWLWSPNLTIRVSIHLRNKQPSYFWRWVQKEALQKQGLAIAFSQVFDPNLGPATDWHECAASSQNNKCEDCRHCWTIDDVAYPWRAK